MRTHVILFHKVMRPSRIPAYLVLGSPVQVALQVSRHEARLEAPTFTLSSTAHTEHCFPLVGCHPHKVHPVQRP